MMHGGGGVSETETQTQCSLEHVGGIYSGTCMCMSDAYTLHEINAMN